MGTRLERDSWRSGHRVLARLALACGSSLCPDVLVPVKQSKRSQSNVPIPCLCLNIVDSANRANKCFLDNIRYGSNTELIPDEAVVETAKAANAHEVVVGGRLKDGYVLSVAVLMRKREKERDMAPKWGRDAAPSDRTSDREYSDPCS